MATIFALCWCLLFSTTVSEASMAYQPVPKQSHHTEAPFGTLLGTHSPSNVEVYSSNYKTVDPGQWEDPSFFESRLDGIYCGYKWQCVELARRYLLITSRLVFDSIPMAYDIFNLKCVRNVDTNEFVKLAAFKNGSPVPPEVGAMLIWEPKGYFDPTGHVAIITNVQPSFVDIIEQNVEDAVWPKGQNYSRRLPREGNSIIPLNDGSILGWVNIYPNEKFEYVDYPNAKSSDLAVRTVLLTDEQKNQIWLNSSFDYIKLFIEKNGPELSSSNTATYYTISESAMEGYTTLN
jgi:glutathionylspermidine amidase/synthetase